MGKFVKFQPMKHIYLFVSLFVCINGFGQNYPATENLTIDTARHTYLRFSPTNTYGSRRELEVLKDSSWWMWTTNRYYFWNMKGNLNLGSPTNMAWFSADSGRLMSTPLSSIGLSSFSNDGSIMTASRAADSISVLRALINTKYTTPAGTTSQYIRGDGTLATFPSIGTGTVTSVGITGSDFSISSSPITSSGNISLALANSGITAGTYGRLTVNAKGIATAGKRQETYSGTTDASGVYTVTFSTPYSVAPNIQAGLVGGTALNGCTYTVSTTGFTVTAYTRSTVSSLPVLGVLAATLVGTATNPLVGGAVDVLITEK